MNCRILFCIKICKKDLVALHLHSQQSSSCSLIIAMAAPQLKNKFYKEYRIRIEMKNLFLLVILMLGTTITQAQTSKTLVKSVALAGTQEVVVNLPGAVESSEWDNDFIRVTTYLTVENMSENIVKQLVLVGRYNLESNLDEATGTLLITMPKIGNQVRVKGVALVETLRFEVQAPAGYKVGVQQASADNFLRVGGGPAL